MAKVILFVLMLTTLLGLGSCASIFWNTTNAQTGSWTDGRNWQNGTAPGANDCAYVSATGNVLIPAGVSVGNVTFTGGATVVVSGGTFTVGGVLALRSGVTLRVDTGATISVGAHLEIGSNGISFTLYGTATAAALKTTGVLNYPSGITNNGPSSVLLTGALGHVIDTSFLITANTFTFSQTATHNFYQTAATGGSNLLTFTYTPTLTAFNVLNNYYNPIPVSFRFLQGANFLNTNPITISNSTGTKGAVTFQGTFTLAGNPTNIAAIPTFQGTTLVINGGVLTFSDVDPTFTGSSTLIGTGGLSFASTDSNGRTASFSGTVNVNLPTFTFSRTGTPIPPLWSFSGGIVNINTPFTIATVFNVGSTLTFTLPVTINTGGHLRGGAVTFFDGIINNGGTQPWTFTPTFKCNANNFNVTGSGSLSLLSGLVIDGCTVNTQTTNQIVVSSPITVSSANSTIDVTQINLNISGTTSFSFNGPSQTNVLSLTIKGAIQNIPVNFTFNANDIDVVLNSSLAFIFGTTLGGTGQSFFTLNGGLTLGDNNQINAGTTVALPSGPYAINPTNTQALPTNWNGKLLLRNTILSGTGQILFNGQLIILNGFNYINTNNFVINTGLSVTYQPNQTAPLSFENPTLVFNAGTTRSLNNGITAGAKVAIVINDGLTLTTSLSFVSTAAGASITFNQSQAQVITLNGLVTDQYTVNGNTIFNSTSNRFINNGIFVIQGNITTTGSFNNPAQTNDATVLLGPNFIVAAGNTIFGPTVLLNSAFTTDDNDRNSSTALTSITFNYTSTLYPIPGNSYTFLTNVTFLGPVIYKSTTPVSFTGSTGFLIFSGNCMIVQSSINFNIRTVFANALNISANSQGTSFTVTVNGANQPSTNDGLWIGGNLFLNLGITLNVADSVNVYFLNSLTVFGTGTFQTNSATFIGNNAVVNIQTLNVNLLGGTTKSTTFLGSGSTTYNLTPFNSNGNFFTNLVTNVPVNYNGATVNLNGQTTFPTGFTFTNTTTTFMGTGPLIFSGVRTLNNNNAYVFNNIADVRFQNTVNLGTAVPFTSTGTTTTTITFLYDINLSLAVTIPLSVTFGFDTSSSITVSGNTLTLTGKDITVNGNVIISSNAGIVSNKVNSPIQTITGNSAFYGSLWTYSVPVCFTGTFNFTSPISFTQPHILKGGLPTALTFPQGLSFTNVGGLSGNGQICLFNYLNNTISTAVTLTPGVTVNTAGTPFLVTGSFFINGTYFCRGQVTFANAITFGYANTLGTSNTINFNDNCQWLGQTSTITIYRSTLNVNKLTTINTPIVLACANSTSATSFVGASATTLFINNDITVSAPTVNLNSAALGPINIITTYYLANINGLNPTNVLTFNSVPSTAEPIVAFSPAVSQPLNLLAPVRFNGLTVGQNAAIYSTNSAGRADIADSLTATATVSISVPTNLFVTSNATGTQFTVTLSGTRTVLSLSPSLTNPFFTGFTAPSFFFSVAQDDVVRFTTTGTLSFNNVRVTGAGVTRFSSGTFSLAGTLQVDAGAIFWQDLSTITAFNTTVVPAANSGSMPGYYQVTVGSAAPPSVTSQYALYGGAGIVYLSGYTATATQTFNIFTTQVAAFGNVLAPVVGTPGYSYSYSRNGNGLTLTITPNQAPIPIPTQSNGPAPPVSAAPSQIFSFVVLFVSLVLVFIC